MLRLIARPPKTIAAAFAPQAYGQLTRVFGFDPASLPANERGHKERGTRAALYHLGTIMPMLLLGGIWLVNSQVRRQAA